ncbi:MAG: hypothetical protein AB7F96_07970 [Beijerinckiaceae bacterium]
MPLPPFDMRGLLPPVNGGDDTNPDRSPYFCTMTELCLALGTSDHRRLLLRNLIGYRALIASDDFVNGVQFVNGSFVEDIEATERRQPNDIDVFSILTPPAKYVSSPALWQSTGSVFWQNEIINNAKNKTRFSVDCYALMLDVGNLGGFLRQSLYWYSLFSHKRTNHDWKDFVALPLNTADDQAALAAIAGGP